MLYQCLLIINLSYGCPYVCLMTRYILLELKMKGKSPVGNMKGETELILRFSVIFLFDVNIIASS